MRRIIFIAATLAISLPIIFYGGIYLLSEARLRDVKRGPAFDHPIPTDHASITWGEHLARTRGCVSCHGDNLEGHDFGDEWEWPDRAVAPNLAAYAKANAPAVVEAAVRQGIGRNGRAMTSMPSFNFKNLTDQDMAAIIAFLQSAPVVEKKLPAARLGWAVRADFARGIEMHMGDWAVLTPPLRVDRASDPQRADGEYLALTMCNECHGLDVRGESFYSVMDGGAPTPDLAIVAAYTRAEFATLLKTGVASGGRRLGLMSRVAPVRFPALSEAEIDALYAYLTSLANEPAAQNVRWRTPV